MVKYPLECALRLSMIVTMFGSLLILILGLCLYFSLDSLLVSYFVGMARNHNTTKFLINAQESIVPSKDDLPEEIDLGNWPQFVSFVISSVGASLFLFSLFGYIAITSRNTDYLIILVTITTVGLICQFLIFGGVIDLNSSFHTSTKERLVKFLQEKYEVGAWSNSSFTFMMNSVMLMGQCCGIEGPGDFLEMGTFNFTYVLEGKKYYSQIVFPLACCKRFYINKGFKATMVCAVSRDITDINKKGCYEEVYLYIYDNHGRIVTSVFVLLIFWEMLQILAGLAILFAPSNVESNAISQVFKTSEYEDVNKGAFQICDPDTENSPIPRMAIFVPFANIPSNGIKDDQASQIW